ncbi:hypothetical protein VTN77DRAFT_7195 [Rasamsonia byssochlamydoides]|uniref:uncharacterized protein n=1 Tax=Rasamsonia byssochlamydoides TaxID=89139 RepID=UPI003742D8D2
MTDRSGRWNPRLSTVPSQWSEERKQSAPSASTSRELVGKREKGHLRSKTASTIWIVDESSGDEHLDSLSNLPQSSLRHIPSAFLDSNSSASRSNSVRSLRRPGSSSSSSIVLNTLPNWVRLYYSGNWRSLQNSGLTFLDSRPSTASRPASPVRYISQVPASVSRPRTRPREDSGNPPRLILDHPADPRSHWKGEIQQSGEVTERLPSDRMPRWSPHLHPDKSEQNPRNTWTAPSLDSTREPLFGRRNVQIYSFCLGFVFPLAWLIAAFLPLPPKPVADEEAVVGPCVETRIREFEERRYQNARWWRNVNRVMIPVGMAIVAVIVTLAVVGTTMGFY